MKKENDERNWATLLKEDLEYCSNHTKRAVNKCLTVYAASKKISKEQALEDMCCMLKKEFGKKSFVDDNELVALFCYRFEANTFPDIYQSKIRFELLLLLQSPSLLIAFERNVGGFANFAIQMWNTPTKKRFIAILNIISYYILINPKIAKIVTNPLLYTATDKDFEYLLEQLKKMHLEEISYKNLCSICAEILN